MKTMQNLPFVKIFTFVREISIYKKSQNINLHNNCPLVFYAPIPHLIFLNSSHAPHFRAVRFRRALSLSCPPPPQCGNQISPLPFCGNWTLHPSQQRYMLTSCFTGFSLLHQFICPKYSHRKSPPQAPYKFQVPWHSGLMPSSAQPGCHSATYNKSCLIPLALCLPPLANLTRASPESIPSHQDPLMTGLP